MAIIAPSLAFEGQAVSQGEAGRIIKPDVKLVNFRSKETKNGIYLYILPPYKADTQGRGVWYKVLNVRADFGTDTKERFVEVPDSPVAYFAGQAKFKYPQYMEIQKGVRDGRDVKIHPTCGRITKRFLYNVAFANALHEGAHVAEVPSFGFADAIDKYHRKPLLDGSAPSLVCDPTQATPVFCHMNLDSQGQPWQVQPEPSQKAVLPAELSDTDYLYNLDDVYVVPDNEELYEKLRVITPAQVFNDCMAGWGSTGAVAVGFAPQAAPAAPAAAPVAQTIAKPVQPITKIAKPAPVGTQSAPALNNIAPVERVVAPAASNPLAATNESVNKWLRPSAPKAPAATA